MNSPRPNSVVQQPTLTDRDALLRQRRRAAGRGHVDLLHRIAAAELKDRLDEINRTFQRPAIVTGFPEFWSAEFPHFRVIPDDPVLDLAPDSHDLIIHAMSLHWADDPVGQIVQSARALVKDGLFIAVCFGGQTLHELRAAMAAAESEVTGGLSPRVLPMGEIRDLGSLLQRAGFALPVADSHRFDVSYPDAIELMRDLRGMGETNVLTARHRRPMPRAMLARAADIYAEHCARPDRGVAATFEVVCVTGWAPSADPPIPLRPGSATARLADALGATEQSAGEQAGKDGSD